MLLSKHLNIMKLKLIAWQKLCYEIEGHLISWQFNRRHLYITRGRMLLYISQSGKVTQELKVIKGNISLLAEIGYTPKPEDYLDLSSWLPSGIGSWLRTVLQTGLLLFILIICIVILTKCLLKIITSVVTCLTTQVMFAQLTMLDVLHWDRLYESEDLEEIIANAFTRPFPPPQLRN